MDTQTGGAPPPDSKDLVGWRKAITEDRLKLFRPEALACAFQDLGNRDKDVQLELAKHLSDVILKILKRRVAFTRHNREDIIYRAHGEIWKALLQPGSADGRALRVAFGSRVVFRMKDAISREQRESRIGEDTVSKSAKTEDNDQTSGIDIRAMEGVVEDIAEPADMEDARTPPKWDASLLHGVKKIDEQIDVDAILACVPNDLKRLAFRLHMDGMPLDSKAANVPTVAKAVGRSERTVRTWIEEVQTLLKKNEGVTHLVTTRGGR